MKLSFVLFGFLASIVTSCPGHDPAEYRRHLETRNTAVVKPKGHAILNARDLNTRAVSPNLLASTTVKATVLVIARNNDEARSVTSGLNGYGVPFQVLLVPQAGVALPTLSNTAGGLFGSIVALSGLAYNCTSRTMPCKFV